MPVRSLGREDPLEEKMATHSSVLAWRLPRTEESGELQSVGRKGLDMTERLHFQTFHFHAPEREMATHSSILFWRIPGTGAWWAAVYEVAQSWTRLT